MVWGLTNGIMGTPPYNISLRIMTGRDFLTIIVPCDLIINIQWSVVSPPSNEQEGSNK